MYFEIIEKSVGKAKKTRQLFVNVNMKNKTKC